jgi:hypothetical protein
MERTGVQDADETPARASLWCSAARPAAPSSGGPGHVVAIEIPETPEPLVAEALQIARVMKARICAARGTRWSSARIDGLH